MNNDENILHSKLRDHASIICAGALHQDNQFHLYTADSEKLISLHKFCYVMGSCDNNHNKGVTTLGVWQVDRGIHPSAR